MLLVLTQSRPIVRICGISLQTYGRSHAFAAPASARHSGYRPAFGLLSACSTPRSLLNGPPEADGIKAALMKNGIPPNRIKISAPQEDTLLTGDEQTHGKAPKRRVEFVLRAKKPS